MAYESNNRQRRNHHHNHHQVYEWNPSNDYQRYEYEAVEEPEVRRSYYNKPRVYNQVGLKSNMEEEVAEVDTSSLAETESALDHDHLRHRTHNKNEDVDKEADTFIKLEHRRMYLTNSNVYV